MTEAPARQAIDALARRIKQLEEGHRRLARSPQLTRSSIDNGALNVRDAAGQLTGILGKQYDGTFTAASVAGPVPPQPVMPDVVAMFSGLRIRHDGRFAAGDGVVAPMDFARFEIHVSPDPDLSGLLWSTLAGELNSARGGEVVVTGLDPTLGYYVRVITRTQSGKTSEASDVAGPFHPMRLQADLVDVDWSSLSGERVFFGADDPVDPAVGDLWLAEVDATPTYETRRWDGVDWVPVIDQGVTEAVAQAVAAAQLAGTKNRVWPQSTAPTGLTVEDAGDVWVNTAPGAGNAMATWDGDSWEPRLIGNGAIEPESLVASDVIATGTVTAALLEALMVLTNVIIAGNPSGTHARMTPTGFRVFAEDPVDGIPNEAARLGTDTNDYFGIIDALGFLVASIDDTGAVNARTANFREDIIVEGRSLAEQLAAIAGGQVGKWSGLIPGLNGATGIRSEYGICQFTFPVVAGRSYLLRFDGPAFSTVDSSPTAEVYLRVRTALNATVTLSSTELRIWPFSGFPDGRLQIPNRAVVFDATATGTLSVGLSLELALPPSTTSVVKVSDSHQVFLEAYDMGATLPGTAGQVTSMGGQLYGGPPPSPPPAAVKQYNTGWMSPAGWRTFRGNGTERTDVPGPVQGWDPSGFNGDGGGFWWWNLPSISGSVDEVWVWLESLSTYYNSGGTARLAPIRNGATYPVNSYKLAADYDVPGFPKPGSKQVNISGWKNLFHNSQGANRAIGVSVGTIGSTDLQYYVRFGGPSARLLIKYTQ